MGFLFLSLEALLPVAICVGIYILELKTNIKKHVHPILREVIIGVIFGGIAILGTECGVTIGTATYGAVVNARDAAPLIAGLFLGGPAGIIAGLIGGIERWFAVYWLANGSFTRIACSVATCCSGFFAAFVRHFVFDKKRPGFIISFVFAAIVEVFHLLLVYLSNMSDPVNDLRILRVASVPMILANSFAVMFASMCVYVVNRIHQKQKIIDVHRLFHVSDRIQQLLAIATVAMLLISVGVTFNLQSQMCNINNTNELSSATNEMTSNLVEEIRSDLLSQDTGIVRRAFHDIDDGLSVSETKTKYNLEEIYCIDSSRHIYDSTETSMIGNIVSHITTPRLDYMSFFIGSEITSMDSYGKSDSKDRVDDSPVRYASYKDGNKIIIAGVSEQRCHSVVVNNISKVSLGRMISTSSVALFIDESTNTVLSCTDILVPTFNEEKLKTVKNYAENSLFSMNLKVNQDPEEQLCFYESEEGLISLHFISSQEAYQNRDIAIYSICYILIIGFGLLFIIIFLNIKYLIVEKMDHINKSLEKITNGDLEEKVSITSTIEFNELANGINQTVDTLKTYIAEASTRIDQELEYARNIQLSVLPTTFPNNENYEIFALTKPAKEVGGDFYDYYSTASGKCVFIVADVSDKGIPASLFMMRAKTELQAVTENDNSLDDVFTTVNKVLCEGNGRNMFVTAWEGSVDLSTGDMELVNAGHNPPLIAHENGEFEFYRGEKNIVLACFDGANFKKENIKLLPGDTVFLYTDGVTDALNEAGESFKEDKLLEVLNSANSRNAQELVSFVKDKLKEFIGNADQFDDITMLAFNYKKQQ